jgi:hypothetical protein
MLYEKLARFTTEWDNNGQQEFTRYFTTEWINSRFNNWPLFVRAAGIPGTNNSLEGFNHIIKEFIGKSKKYQIIPLINSKIYLI